MAGPVELTPIATTVETATLPQAIESILDEATWRRARVLHPLNIVDRGGKVTGRIPVMGRVEQGWFAVRAIRLGGRWRFLPTTALTFRREIGEAIFPIPPQLRHTPATLCSRCSPLLTTVDYVDVLLAAYRLHGENVTSRRSYLLDGGSPECRHLGSDHRHGQ
jgi:hypothetical protein